MRTLLARLLMLLAVATLPGTRAEAAPAATPSFELMIADAKATMLIDPRKTIAKARAAERAAERLNGRERVIGIATTQWLQGEAYLRLDDVEDARPQIDQALAAVSVGGAPTKLNGDLLLSRGGLHTELADVAAALSDYQQAHTIFQRLGETRSRAVALVSIALLYQEAHNYENALKYSAQAVDIYRGDPQLLLTIYNNRGVCLQELGRYPEAEKQFREALMLARTMGSPVLQVQILRNIARAQLANGMLAGADRTIAEKSVIAARAGVADAQGQDDSLAAQAALQHGQLGRAAALIAHVFDGVDPTRTTLAFREAHKTAYALFKKLGDEPAALVHLEAIKRLDDQTSELASSANTALAAARFNYANQETRIATLKADELQRNVDFERARARTQQFIFIGITIVILVIVSMLGIGLITIRRSRNQVRAVNIDLAATNRALGKALAAKTEFLATTSHEIRTPLNGILGMTQVMLADRSLSAPMRDRIGIVHGAGISMRALVDDILDVAKMETGNLTIERAPMDLKAMLTDVTRMWEEQARGRGIAFTLDLADCPDHIEGDAARLRQIVFNLLSNALKFTERGAVGVRATASPGATPPTLAIVVTDTGIGIPADKQELIFESFRQVDAGTTRNFGGTGLGLAICRNLARAMDGDVRVASEPGAGATFTLELPLLLAAAPAGAAPVAGAERGLLILDRSPITRSMLRAVLEKRAGVVLVAGSVDEALEQLRGGGVARLLIDDATMKAVPAMADALAALAAGARAAGATTALLWAGPDEAQRAILLATGIDRVIAKPIAGAALAEALYPADDHASSRAHLVPRAA